MLKELQENITSFWKNTSPDSKEVPEKFTKPEFGSDSGDIVTTTFEVSNKKYKAEFKRNEEGTYEMNEKMEPIENNLDDEETQGESTSDSGDKLKTNQKSDVVDSLTTKAFNEKMDAMEASMKAYFDSKFVGSQAEKKKNVQEEISETDSKPEEEEKEEKTDENQVENKKYFNDFVDLGGSRIKKELLTQLGY